MATSVPEKGGTKNREKKTRCGEKKNLFLFLEKEIIVVRIIG